MSDKKEKDIQEAEVLVEPNDAKERKSDSFWKIAVVALFAIVLVQMGMMFKLMDRNGRRDEAVDKSPVPKGAEEKIVLKPRPQRPPAAPSAPTAPTRRTAAPKSSGLRPQPLPHLNVNLNRGCGAPVITTAPQPPPRQRQTPVYRTYVGGQPGGGMSIHISQTPFDPFGASFGFGPSFGGRDIREEIARMERMMDAMMNATMSGFTFNPPRLTATPPPNPFARRMGSTMSFGVSSPSVKNEKDAYVVQLKIPGLDQTQVDAKVEGGMLVVSGIKREELNNQGQGFVSYSSTLSSFHNSFPLPGPVKADGLKVSYDKKKELLTVRIPKKK